MGPGVLYVTPTHTHVEIQFALVHTFDMIHTNIVIQLPNTSPLACTCTYKATVKGAMLHMVAWKYLNKSRALAVLVGCAVVF